LEGENIKWDMREVVQFRPRLAIVIYKVPMGELHLPAYSNQLCFLLLWNIGREPAGDKIK